MVGPLLFCTFFIKVQRITDSPESWGVSQDALHVNYNSALFSLVRAAQT